MTIAIDGPVGAGKSTIAQGVADALGVLHLDTGAMYRAMGLKALRAGIDPKDAAAAEALCAETDISVEMGANGQKTLLDGEDVSSLIRTAEVSAAASGVSTVKAVPPYGRPAAGLREEGVHGRRRARYRHRRAA